jgi:hypothetical protein
MAILTQQEKNIKLCEFRGWKLIHEDISGLWSWQNPIVTHRDRWTANKDMAAKGVLPDHFSDLNAVHEVELSLSEEDHRRFVLFLDEICLSYYKSRSATAAQRAEALGITLNLWE